MIELRGVGHSFETASRRCVNALDSVSLSIADGEFVAIVGQSGCGKSTLLEIIAGLKRPTRGQVFRGGKPVGGHFGWAGYLTQADTLLPWRNVLGNACLGLELRGVPRVERERIVRPILERFGLSEFENAYPSELSGGMLKRASLARVLAYAPQVLLLDEPFAPLDAQTRERLQADLLALWKDTRKTVILVTHDITEAVLLSERIAVLGPRPATVADDIPVTLPHPRDIADPECASGLAAITARIRSGLGAAMEEEETPVSQLPDGGARVLAC